MKKRVKKVNKYLDLGIIAVNLGILALTFVISSEDKTSNFIFVPLFIGFELLAIACLIKSCLDIKREEKGENNVTQDTFITYKKFDVGAWMCLLAAFGSLFTVVSSIILLFFLNKGLLDLLRYFIVAISCIHVFLVIISFILFFKIVRGKK